MIVSPIPYVLCMTLYVLGMTLVVRHTRFLLEATQRTSGQARFNVPLEGLRGLLAISVYFHHAVVTYFFFTNGGSWSSPPSRLYEHLGFSSVQLFFHLTGYLFWSKLMREKSASYGPFLRARARRLLPAYYLAVSLVFLVVALSTGFTLQEAGLEVLGEAAQWLTIAPLGDFPAINGFDHTVDVIAGVLWTLRIECIFYLVLPLLVVLVPGRRLLFALAALALLYLPLRLIARGHWIDPARVPAALLTVQEVLHRALLGFAPGMLAAYLRLRHPALIERVSQRWLGLVPALALVAVVTFTNSGSYGAAALLALAFVFVALGSDIFGLLLQPALLAMGLVSYSTYLLHGIVLWVVLHGLNELTPIAQMSGLQYWLWVGPLGLVVLLLSVLSYRLVEARWLAVGHHAVPKGAPVPAGT